MPDLDDEGAPFVPPAEPSRATVVPLQRQLAAERQEQGGDAVAPDNVVYGARFSEIRGDPYNVRGTLENIPKLADSIRRYGLLENLVGIEIPLDERTRPEEWIELKAGSRRLAAIALLVEQGAWPPVRRIPIVIIDSDGFWEHMVENVQRQGVKPWELGRRLAEAESGGHTHREIGTRLGHSSGWVGRHIQIGKGLSPEAILHIEKSKIDLSIGELFQLAAIVDRFGDPDGKAQIEAIDRRKKRAPQSRRSRDSLRSFALRIRYMESQMPIPPLIRPVVMATLGYLAKGGKPNFRALCDQLKGERVKLDQGPDDDEDEDDDFDELEGLEDDGEDA